MNITTEQNGNWSVVKLEGDVDMYSSPQLRSQIQALLQKKVKKICFDFSKVKYMDSSGIATLIEAQQKLGKEKGELRLVGVSSSIMSVFEIAKLDRFFKIYPTAAEALKEV